MIAIYMWVLTDAKPTIASGLQNVAIVKVLDIRQQIVLRKIAIQSVLSVLKIMNLDHVQRKTPLSVQIVFAWRIEHYPWIILPPAYPVL